MRNKLIAGSGGLCLLLFCSVITGWWSPQQKESPALCFEEPKCLISLGEGFTRRGVHQINDACSWVSVTELTDGGPNEIWLAKNHPEIPPVSGEHFEIVGKPTQKQLLSRSWMSAGQRIALGLALHPDRMTAADWESLPGVGPVLAGRIEMSRQINGDFECFDELLRVNGIGMRSLEKWRGFF